MSNKFKNLLINKYFPTNFHDYFMVSCCIMLFGYIYSKIFDETMLAVCESLNNTQENNTFTENLNSTDKELEIKEKAKFKVFYRLSLAIVIITLFLAAQNNEPVLPVVTYAINYFLKESIFDDVDESKPTRVTIVYNLTPPPEIVDDTMESR